MNTSIFFVIAFIIILYFLFKKKSTFNNICKNIEINKAFLLTLGTHTDRYKTFIKSYDIEVPLEVIIGENTKDPSISEKYRYIVSSDKFNDMYNFDKGLKIRPNHTYFNSGALGCYLGHMEFYKRSFEQNLNYSIIFEDNVILDKSFKYQLDKTIKSLPNDFDVIFFHSFRHVGDKVIRCDKNMDLIKWVNSTKCYLINVNNMRKYYNLFFPIDNHIDRIYEKLIFNGAIIYYIPLNGIKLSKANSTINHTGIKDGKEFFYFNDLLDSQIVIDN
jgi:GR25 family glycosyltransferase involved in LPS biosynthesis